MRRIRLLFVVVLSFSSSFASAAPTLTLIDQFSTSGGIGLAFDSTTDTLWTYGSDTIRQYSNSGSLLNTFSNVPGESADDADLDFAHQSFTLGETYVPAGSLLFTNGETSVAEIYALDSSAALLGTLETEFGNSHVVGSAYSPLRGSMFLVQDSVPIAEVDNRIAEVDVVTGEVLNTHDLSDVAPSFSVFYGDLEVSAITGDLFLVSSSETTILQLSPTGSYKQELTLTSGSGGSLRGSGIALDDARHEIYVQSVSGTVYRYAIEPDPGDFDIDIGIDGNDFLEWQRTDGTAANLAAWEANYGGSFSGSPLSAHSIPEPCSSILAIACACTLLVYRKNIL